MPEPNTGCVLWIGCSDKNGYGKIYFSGKHQRVHRLVFSIRNKIKIDPSEFILHKCDTPSCCNIDHLEMGNALTNMEDKVRKGRLRNQHMGKSKCKHGHDISNPESYYFYGIKRICKKCHAIRARKQRHKNLKVSKNCSNGKTDDNESTR